MTRRKWTITTELTGRERKIDVVLYDSLGSMRGAATRHAKLIGEPQAEDGYYDNALGVYHSFSRIKIGANESETEMPEVGLLRLVRGHLRPEVIAHEVAHMTMHLYGIDVLTMKGQSKRAVDHFDAGNEDFAYLMGALFAIVWEMLADER